MGNSRRVSHSFNINIAADCFNAHLSVKIARFYAKNVASKFQKVETKTYHHSKLWMDTRKIFGNYRVKCSDNGQLSAVFLREITKCK
jgi:hypothetical protein